MLMDGKIDSFDLSVLKLKTKFKNNDFLVYGFCKNETIVWCWWFGVLHQEGFSLIDVIFNHFTKKKYFNYFTKLNNLIEK